MNSRNVPAQEGLQTSGTPVEQLTTAQHAAVTAVAVAAMVAGEHESPTRSGCRTSACGGATGRPDCPSTSTTLLASRLTSAETHKRFTFSVPCIGSDAALLARAALLPQHYRGELQQLDPACFPPGSEYSAARCCDTRKGAQGDERCWTDGFNHTRCCPHADIGGSDSGNPKDRW